MNDIELWRSFKSGDDNAFALLYRTYVEVLYRYGHKLTTDTGLVEDSIQDMFIELWKSRQRLSDTDSIKYYLFRILRRKITQNPMNRHGHDTSTETLEPRLFSVSAENEIIELEQEHTRNRVISSVLLKLPARQQEAVNLRYFHGFNHQQIADIMHISLQSVHNTLQKSMKGLREMLSDYSEIIISILVIVLFR